MSKNPLFPLVAYDDWYIVSRINIKSAAELKAEKSNILIPDSSPGPKNIQDIERERARKVAQYEEAEEKFLSNWPEHPNQGVIVAAGDGRHLEEGVKIPMKYKVGDRVYLRGQVGEPIIYKNKVYWMIKQHDIFCKDPDPKKQD